jgi:hypothetical protein
MTESLSDIFSNLPWLKNYQVPGYPDNVITVEFWPARFQKSPDHKRKSPGED